MIELIPAIDLIDGKCVRLTKGDYATQKTYNEDPVAVAREFESYGFKRLHVVDLDGARSKHIVNHKVLERLASATGLTIDFGGGIKADEDLRIAFESGAALVTIGSVAATRIVPRMARAIWVRPYHIGRRCQRRTDFHQRLERGKHAGVASFPPSLHGRRRAACALYGHQQGRHVARPLHRPLPESHDRVSGLRTDSERRGQLPARPHRPERSRHPGRSVRKSHLRGQNLIKRIGRMG